MSAPLQNLLDRTMRLKGLRGAGVMANDQILTRTLDPGLSEAELGKVWRQLSEAVDVSQHHRIAARQMRWIFENVLVYGVKRNDGMLLGLVFGRASASEIQQEMLDALFEDFRRLQLT